MARSGRFADARRRYRSARDNYLIVFVLLLCLIGLIAAVDPSRPIGVLAITGVQSLALVMTLRNAGVHGARLNLARGLAVLPVFTALAAVLLGRGVGPVYFISSIVLILATQGAIIVHALRRGRITADTVMGALCVYLLLGLLFGTLAAFYASAVAPFFVQAGAHRGSDFVYFSFITLETVGYGDLTPAAGFPRMLALAEGLLGQLYLVTVISLLVGNLGARRLQGRDDDGDRQRPSAEGR